MIVVKFGGSSLTGAQRMLAAARIVASHTRSEPVVCVVSAMAGVTDQLISIANQTLAGPSAWQEAYDNLRARHEETLAKLAAPAATKQHSTLTPLWDALEADTATLAPMGEGHARTEAVAVFSAWGERLAVRLFQAALARVGLEASCFEDAPVIVEYDTSLAPPHWAASVAATCAWLREPVDNLLRWGQTPVLPGYLALRQDGQYTTLGRNGSDHSAAVIAAALDASAVYLYSDVAGVYQADPHLVPQAKLLAALTYDEAATIAAHGARVLHPATLPPLAQRHIPLRLRSAFHPDAPGTDIGLARTYMFPAFLPALTVTGCGAKVGRPDAF
jgi:aspartate kinase